MQLLSQSVFRKLGELEQPFSISTYLPTHMAGSEVQQDRIRLKNLLSEAENKLVQAGMSETEAESTLSTAALLIEDENFWRYQSHGLTLFITPEETRIYRLPLSFETLVTVSDRFHLKPLLPLFFDNRYFYILALSQNKVRFFQATRYQVSEVDIEGVPTSLDVALKYDDPEKQLQYHSSNSGGGQPVYHGQGAGTDDENSDIRRFLTQVNRELQSYLSAEEVPLVVASVESVHAIYKDVNTYAHLLDERIAGNPDVTKPEELRDAAWPKVAALIERSHQEALTNYKSLRDTEQASDEVSSVVLTAHRGQIDTLFVVANAHVWGQFDATSGKVEEGSSVQSADLLDLAAVQTFLQGGTVYTLPLDDMPSTAPVAAIYRYSVPAEANVPMEV
mgnify:CR=1 FL=1